jgi:hypothetical protein
MGSQCQLLFCINSSELLFYSEFQTTVVLLQALRLRFLGQISALEPLATKAAGHDLEAEIWRLRSESILLFGNGGDKNVVRAENSLQRSARYRMAFCDMKPEEVTKGLPQKFTYLSVWSMILFKKGNSKASFEAAKIGVEIAISGVWNLQIYEFHSLCLLSTVGIKLPIYTFHHRTYVMLMVLFFFMHRYWQSY